MPSAPALPRVQVLAYTRVCGEVCLNVLDYFASEPPTNDQLSGFGDAWVAATETAWKACLDASNSLIKVTVKRLLTMDPFEFDDNTWAGAGTVSGSDPMPSGVCVNLRKIAPGPSRRARGLMFLSGIPETFTTNGRLNSTGRTAAQALGDALDAQIVDDGINYDLAVLSRADDLLYFPAQFTAEEILVNLSSRRPPL